MSSKLTAVLKKLHGKSFHSLPFNNNDSVSGVHLDSIFPPSDSDISSNREPTPDGMELKLEPDEQEVLMNGEDPATGEEITPAEHDHHSSSEVSDPHEEREKHLFAPEHSISSDKFPSSKDCLEKLECLGESAIPTPTSADREMTEENAEVKNDDMKTSDELNKKSRRKQQKTHRCVTLDDSLLNSPPSDMHLTNLDGSSHGNKSGRSDEPAEMKQEIESPFDLPEGTVFVQPESVDTSPKVVSLETSRSKKIFKGGSLESAILHCTACNKQLGIDGLMDFHRHPMLKVLVCRKCYNWYTSAEIDQDADGTDEQCRWCRQGGDLICCDFCHNSFCKSCIRRNLGRKELHSILNTDDNSKWKCYVCDPRHLLGLIEHCSGVMEALAKQEKRQQEMELKRKRNVKTGNPSQISSCSSTSTVSRPSNFSTTSVAGKSQMATTGVQQQGHLKVARVIEQDRRNSDGKTESRLIIPRPANINHSFPGVSSSSDGFASHKSGFQVKSNKAVTSHPSSSSSAHSSATGGGFSEDQMNLQKVDKLVVLTSNMEFTLAKLLKETRKIFNSAASSSDASAAVSTSDIDERTNAVCAKLLKAHNFYLDAYKTVSGIGKNKKLTALATGLKVPVVSLLGGQTSVKGNTLPSVIKDPNGNGKILVCKVTGQSKQEVVNGVGLAGTKVWLTKNVGGSVVMGRKHPMLQAAGSRAQPVAQDCGKSTRTVIKIKPTSSMAAAAIASGSIPLIINDSNGQQKMVLAPIVVKPVAPKQSSSPIVAKNKPVSKDNEICVISDSDDEVERTDTVNLPEIIIHDVVVEDSLLPSDHKQQIADSTGKSNSLVLTDKFLNRAEIDHSKKSEDDHKTSPRHKRKKENDDDFVEVQLSTKKLKEDAVVTLHKKSPINKTSLPPASQKANLSSQVGSIPALQKPDSNDNKVTSSGTTPPLLVSNDEKSESKSQISSSELDPKTSEHGGSQPEVKVPKKRGRKRKAEKEAEATNTQQNELKLDQPSLRRSSRRASLPMSEVNDIEPGRGIKRPSSDAQSDKPANGNSNGNKESDKNSGSNQKGSKKKKVDSSTKPTPPLVRTRRSLASIPDNIAATDKGKAASRVTRAANRKSSGC